MKIALVAMPWPLFDSPSSALGMLKGLLKQQRPQVEVHCEYAYLRMWTKLGALYDALSNSRHAELLFVPQLYPKKQNAVQARFAGMLKQGPGHSEELLPTNRPGPIDVNDEAQMAQLFAGVLRAAAELVEELATDLAGKYDVVGFTVTYCQLFASLAVAQRLKEKDPKVTIVFGGAQVDGAAGRSMMSHYGCIDFAVQGEGEKALLWLVDALEQGDPQGEFPGVISRAQLKAGHKPQPLTNAQRLENQYADLDQLPLADYSEYEQWAEEHNIYWHLPLETSRGCWWNRSVTTDDPLNACYFCSLNLGSYREKSLPRVIEEIRTQCTRYANVKLRVMDNVMRKKGLVELFEQINALGMDLRFVTEVRAQVSPYAMLTLWEAGCHHVQIGIEGLSTSYLRRLGKGATTIQNLQALKTCCELNLQSASNLLINFPGATKEEVRETVQHIRDYAVAYHPTAVSHYVLDQNSSVEARPEKFGVKNVRNARAFRQALPKAVAESLRLPWLEYDCEEQVDWKPVEQAVDAWRQFRQELPVNKTFSKMPLFYTDGGSFLEIVDRRDGFRLITLEGIWREVYLYCMQIRRRTQLEQRFADHANKEKLPEVLEGLITEKLMFSERGQFLSLAPAVTPQVAARRIRKAFQEEQKQASGR